MQFNKVEICGVNTAKLKVLKESEKMELLHRIKQGDMKARDELISGNLRLVLSVIPVSYTHLDVYKRQPLNMAVSL